MSQLKSYRVVVVEWLSHQAIIKAKSARHAGNNARDMWAANAEHDVFRFEDGGVDAVHVEEVRP